MEPQQETIMIQRSKINDQVVDITEHDSAAIANKIVVNSKTEAYLIEKNAQNKETASLHIKKVIF
jgi:hypothetical protein